MVSACTSQLHRTSGADNNAFPSRSYFHKTVCLQDWWLTNPWTDDDRKTLGVSGVTSTSQEQRAERHFSSAPILEVYDFFELETVDGVCVILQGFINKARTLDNGFSSEVFNHFVFGFPPNWEEFAKSCVSRGNNNLVNEGEKGFAEGHQKVDDNTNSKSGHLDSETMKMDVQDCEDTMRNELGAKKLNFFDAECSETMGPLSTITLETGCLVAAASENLTFVSSIKDSNEDDFITKTSIDTCENKKTKQTAKTISKLHVAEAEYNLNAAAGKEEFASKEGIMTRSNSKCKTTYGSSSCKVAKRQQITSHRAAKSATRLGVSHTWTASEKVEKASIYPSRSGNKTKQKLTYVSF